MIHYRRVITVINTPASYVHGVRISSLWPVFISACTQHSGVFSPEQMYIFHIGKIHIWAKLQEKVCWGGVGPPCGTGATSVHPGSLYGRDDKPFNISDTEILQRLEMQSGRESFIKGRRRPRDSYSSWSLDPKGSTGPQVLSPQGVRLKRLLWFSSMKAQTSSRI